MHALVSSDVRRGTRGLYGGCSEEANEVDGRFPCVIMLAPSLEASVIAWLYLRRWEKGYRLVIDDPVKCDTARG